MLLEVLDSLKGCFDNDGNRTSNWDSLHASYFKGSDPAFSDSSTSEKNEFKKELTFPCPDDPATPLSCTWHGKVNTPKLRVHYWWPMTADDPIYIVYVGPKITKR